MAGDLMLFLPEAACLLMALTLFGLSLPKHQDQRRVHSWAMGLSLLMVAAGLAGLFQEGHLFFEAYRVDLFSQFFKLLLAVALLLVLGICRQLTGVEERYQPEFFLFLTTCTLGMMLMVSAVELMTLYVALELSSFSLYILVPLRSGDNIDVEAGVKYLFIGITASCLMLFGMSYIFGAVHSTYLARIADTLPLWIHQPGAVIGLLLTLSGFFFKLAAFPFHFWAPDVYQGAANQVTTYIATASKAAAVALLIRLTALSAGTSLYLLDVLMVLCVASMTLGNLAAMVQSDLKRMLAYSSVAHAGYALMGVLTMTRLGYSSAMFYTLAYMVMNFAAFMVVVKVASQGQDLKISDLAGLHRRAPLLALTLMLALFSLAGIPPTVGFTGKFLVFAAAMRDGHFWLVLVGMINATLSLYYYLMVIKAAYLTEPAEPQESLAITGPTRALNYALIAAMVALGLFPRQVLELTEKAVRNIF
ncbi:MAG: NADH-quinone oxidoreductase subunit N [Desulfarculus sp.]|nr:NADH-quinone oxidoreductase subunit N [Desulfarculus sp.]